MTIKARLVAIEPDVVYQGTTYEQRVIVETTKGETFGLFDYDLLASEDMIDKELEISIYAFIPTSAKQTDCSEIGIKPSSKDSRSWKHHIYVGRIIDINSKTHEIELSVGSGTVLVDEDVHSFIKEGLEIGDCIDVMVNRSDLKNIEHT